MKYSAPSLRRRASLINSRARKKGAPGQITASEIAKKLEEAEGRCADCLKAFGARFRDRMVVWFSVPLSRGGECSQANAQIICRECEMKFSADMRAWSGPVR